MHYRTVRLRERLSRIGGKDRRIVEQDGRRRSRRRRIKGQSIGRGRRPLVPAPGHVARYTEMSLPGDRRDCTRTHREAGRNSLQLTQPAPNHTCRHSHRNQALRNSSLYWLYRSIITRRLQNASDPRLHLPLALGDLNPTYTNGAVQVFASMDNPMGSYKDFEVDGILYIAGEKKREEEKKTKKRLTYSC